ncbi:Hydantoinase/oxoprolinase [Desulfonema limicola]|uniref:Hydantoinase/oxoprolinase n=2 Tax=Desulfonema limicola TaxID=45656 RepID=A0A975B6A6_9BACT|nr:hydantoinase/oxoprolinase family protein [Desulfonema limicola]QTA79517.1 Hydantoinase/oxoprolinase [Desulfonema limicola]
MIIGLDVGGTHTDTVLLGKQGLIRQHKVTTDTLDLFKTVLAGLENITKDIDPASISRAVLSTTLTTNAIVQDKNPAVGMIVSGGPGVDPEYFRTNEDYFCVSGSIDHRGREVEPVNEDEILKIKDILKEKGIRNVGIISKFSVRNPKHELAVYNLIKDAFGKIYMGHLISGNLNFPRRIATTYLNTIVHQTHKRFFEAVRDSLKQKGLNIPIHILKADGGTMNFDSSIDFPGQTILSGPSASVMGATAFASEKDETLVLDIGGTTTDMAILVNRVPLLDPQGITLGNYNTLIRSLETRSIGIGGDSHVQIADGKLKIGPERKGPAMAYGGPVPTPTDAMFVMGLMTEGNRDASVKGIEPIAAALDINLEDAAVRIFDHACKLILFHARAMIDAINRKPVYTVHELQEGLVVNPRKILILGGPAPYFAGYLEKISNFQVNTVPHWKVANAIGAALARTTCEVTLFADTQQEIAAAPEENFNVSVSKNFTKELAVEKAFELLKNKAMNIGATADDLEMEVAESQQFNMVRGFYTAGKNIRVKVQVKPGLIHGYEALAQKLLADADEMVC